MSALKIAIVVPVYNHKNTLREVVTRTIACIESEEVMKIAPCTLSSVDILVVDDGSSDNSLEAVQELEIQSIVHEVNKGKGAALLTAMDALLAQGYSHMICLDADAQHFPEDLPQFIQEIIDNPHAFIIGKRDFSVDNIPASSKFGRKFSKFWMFVQTGVLVSDMQSGYRAYPLSAMKCLKLSESRYSFEIEVIVKAAWSGFEIIEIPIQVYYQEGDERISHFDKLKDNVRITLLNTRLTVRALVPIPFSHHVLDLEEEKVSLLSPLNSLKLLMKNAKPKELALASTVAFFICTLPLLGLQSILLLLAINTLKLNRLCALMVIPLSWPPFLPALCILVGYRVWNGMWLTTFNAETLYHQFGHRFLEWILGSVVLAPVLGLLMGLIIYFLCLLVRIKSKKKI